MEFKKVNGDFILKYCEENKQIAWLKEAKATYGKNFLAIKRAFCLKFFPSIVPKAKPKAKGFFERVDEL